MSKHTPGPWSYSRNGGVMFYSESGPLPPTEANANLTIAAPEMFSLLQIIAGEWRSDPVSTQCFDLRIVDKVLEFVDKLEEKTK